jgi:hypothetical protein
MSRSTRGGGRAEASVSSNANRPLHAAALAHQAVFIELATIDAAVTAAQPAVNTSDAGLALAGTAAAGFVQVYFHGCSICGVWQVCPPWSCLAPLCKCLCQNCPATIRNPRSTRFGISAAGATAVSSSDGPRETPLTQLNTSQT